MSRSKRSLYLLLAFVTGASAFFTLVPLRAAADPADLVTICFRSRTILVPLYLLPRYQGAPGYVGLGACVPTP